MTYDMYRYIFIGGAILAGVMLLVSILLFFVLRIPVVIGDLTGANARKGIESIRSQAQSSSGGGHKSKTSSGRKTESFGSKKIEQREDGMHNTSKISTTTPGAPGGNETTVLDVGGNETTVLGGNETTVLGGGNETTVLSAANETTVLDAGTAVNETTVLTPPIGETVAIAQDVEFCIEYDITYIHTDEMIV